MSESVEERRRKEVIDKILTFPANTYTRAFLGEPHPKTGRKYSNSELESYLEQLQSTVSVEDQIVRAQAEIYAERTLHQLRMQQAQEPQRCAQAAQQLAKDKETFAALCRQHGLSECEANLNLWRGSQSIEGLAQASPQESAKFQEEKIENHNDALLKMDPVQLRAQVRQEATDTRVQQAQAETDRQLDALRTKDAPFGYQPLPTEFTKEKLLQMVKNETEKYRFIVKKFGNHNITVRLQGRG